jgi:type 1 glutamine amidotransferase
MALRAALRVGLVLLAAVAISACAGAGVGVGVAGSSSASGAGSAAANAAARTANDASTTASDAAGKPDVLVLTETLGYHHASIPWAVAALKRIAARDGRYRLTFLPGASALAAALPGASAVVFLLTSGELPLDATGKRALLTFVRRGGGLVGFHSATDTFHHWPGFISLIGAEFSHHPLPSLQRLIVEDRRTPATSALPPSIALKEEFYVFRHDPRAGAHILVRLDTGLHGPDRPLVWCKHSGKGRVFYDVLGHFPQTWHDSRQIALASGGLAWAARVRAGRS